MFAQEDIEANSPKLAIYDYSQCFHTYLEMNGTDFDTQKQMYLCLGCGAKFTELGNGSLFSRQRLADDGWAILRAYRQGLPIEEASRRTGHGPQLIRKWYRGLQAIREERLKNSPIEVSE